MFSHEKIINCVIAKECDWKLDRISGKFILIDPSGLIVAADSDPSTTFESFVYKFPNYCGDLNACREFEINLSDEKYIEYTRELALFFLPKDNHIHELLGAYILAIKATAFQRCRAFLRITGNALCIYPKVL